MLAWLAEFIGRVLKHILPALFDEARKPKPTQMSGGDNEVRNDIDGDISGSLERMFDKDNKAP